LIKIGVFDSGLGGLSVLQHLRSALPRASFFYIADSVNAPYGDKSDSFIAERSLAISNFLLAQQVSAIVVACNTATAAAVQLIRQQSPVPVVAIEPALKPAAKLSQSKKIGVLATESTLKSEKYQSLMSRVADNIVFYQQAAHGLVEQVEAGVIDEAATRQLLNQYLQPMLAQGVDTIVLGCTHYPFLMPMIRQLVGEDLNIIDTGRAVSEQLLRVLAEDNQLPDYSTRQHRFFSSGDVQHAENMIARLLGENVSVEKLSV